SAGAQVPRATYRQYDASEAPGDNPERATLELLVRRYLRDSDSGGFRIALQPLQIRANLSGVLVSEISILFQTFVDDAFQFDWQVRIQTYCRGWCPIENRLEDYPRT